MDVSQILATLKDYSLPNLIVIGMFSFMGYYIFITHRATKEINNAVNHKAKDEPTLRETNKNIERMLIQSINNENERFNGIDHTLEEHGRIIKENTSDIKNLKKKIVS